MLSTAVLNFRDSCEGRDSSAALSGAGISTYCMRCTFIFEDMVHGTKSYNCLPKAPAQARRNVRGPKKISEMLKGWRQKEIWSLASNGILSLPSEKSLAECPSFLEKICGEVSPVMKSVSSIFTLEPLQNPQSEVSRPQKVFRFKYRVYKMFLSEFEKTENAVDFIVWFEFTLKKKKFFEISLSKSVL